MSYWKANPHQWGNGFVHVIHVDGYKTLCGKKLSECPGRYIPENEYNCRACARVIDSEEKREQQRERWQQQAAERAREREAADQEWWRRYNAYMQSPQWRQRRAAVFKRANWICEARLDCEGARAVEVHHTTYKHVFNEPLFELVAVCRQCHERITGMDRGASSAPWPAF